MTLGELRALLQKLEKPTDDLAKLLKLFNICLLYTSMMFSPTCTRCP